MARSGRRLVEAEDLNLVPILNVVTIIIPFLLMAAQFVSLAVVDAVLPSIRPPDDDTVDPVDLTVGIDATGFVVSGAAVAELGEGAALAIPCTAPGCPTPEAYDAEALTRLLARVKRLRPQQESVVIAPASDVPYEVLIRAMDASREIRSSAGGPATPLFPLAVISAGRE